MSLWWNLLKKNPTMESIVWIPLWKSISLSNGFVNKDSLKTIFFHSLKFTRLRSRSWRFDLPRDDENHSAPLARAYKQDLLGGASRGRPHLFLARSEKWGSTLHTSESRQCRLSTSKSVVWAADSLKHQPPHAAKESTSSEHYVIERRDGTYWPTEVDRCRAWFPWVKWVITNSI